MDNIKKAVARCVQDLLTNQAEDKVSSVFAENSTLGPILVDRPEVQIIDDLTCLLRFKFEDKSTRYFKIKVSEQF